MANLQLFDPFRDIWDLKDDIDRVFFGYGRGDKGKERPLSSWSPAVDVAEDKEHFKFHVELPGVKKEDVKISLNDGVLSVRGERSFKDEEKKKNYHRIERSYGMFERSFTLPNTVMADKIEANMKDGVLEIMVPKREEAKPKEIEIKVS